MYEQLNAQLAEAKERINRLALVKASLIPARERLIDQAHVVQGIEDCLADVEGQIRSLESFSLKGLIKSLTWKREAKLDRLREEMFDLMPQVEIGEQMLLELEAAVKEIEAEIASLGDAEETYKALCEKKHKQLLAEKGEPAARLQEIAAQLNAAKNDRQSLRKSMHIAKNFIERLRSTSKVVSRAKSKKIHPVVFGAIGSAVVSVVQGQIAEGASRHAGDGLSELARSIENLNMQHGSERDAQLTRVGVMLGHSHADLGGAGTASPILDLINQATELLQSKLGEVEPTIALLEAQHIELVLNA